MKALAIDPHNRTVHSVLIPDPNGNFQALYDFIGCQLVELLALGPDVVAVIDEEGLLKEPDEQAYWRLTCVPTQTYLAGRALVFARRSRSLDGDVLEEPFFTADQLAGLVEWLDPPTEAELADLLTPKLVVWR